MRGHIGRAAILGLAAMALMAAPASAEVRSGSGSDPVDGALAGARDVVGLDASYDTDAGALRATVKLREAPDAAGNALVGVLFAVPGADGRCNVRPAVLLGAFSDPASGDALWQDLDDTVQHAATKTIDGTSVVLAATDAGLAGKAYACAVAELDDPANASTVFDSIDAPVALAAPPPPPSSPTPAPPAPAAPVPAPPAPVAPASPPPGAKPVPVPAGAHVVVTVASAPVARSGRWLAARLQVANTGRKAARRVVLVVAPPRGVRIKQRRIALGTLKPGAQRRVTLRVLLGHGAAASPRIGLSVLSGKARRRGPALVLPPARRTPAARPPAGTPAPAAPAAPQGLAGRLFAHVTPSAMTASEWSGYAFIDDKWAYKGLPEGGFPDCSQPASKCIPYTYDEKTGALKVGDETGSVGADKGTITVGDTSYLLYPLPAPGARWNLSLKGVSIFGFWPNQVITEYWLTMTADGQFSTSASTMGHFGNLGSPVQTDFSSVAPDSHGTYEVQPGGRLHLVYADGHTVDYTIALDWDGKKAAPDPAADGMLLDDLLYYNPDEL